MATWQKALVRAPWQVVRIPTKPHHLSHFGPVAMSSPQNGGYVNVACSNSVTLILLVVGKGSIVSQLTLAYRFEHVVEAGGPFLWWPSSPRIPIPDHVSDTVLFSRMDCALRALVERGSTHPKTRVTPSRAATKRLCFFSMCKTKARQYADQALITFRPTEVFANKVVDRFEDALFTLPVVAEARKEHVNKIRKLGGVILANVAILNMSWQGFLRAHVPLFVGYEVKDLSLWDGKLVQANSHIENHGI
ncbi:hypothetical protein B0F90DRAFT_1669194 [Multifurca ochricompacta]|uniref:Uncharacterized protein n=1 Tax=Multifurca ochricompacta TaxID=376703 RepID=A0AAD4M112_9AGAM|nr:hypothetical protein B0F90DRAFT_1669194 [Multifurca ochricompacta]